MSSSGITAEWIAASAPTCFHNNVLGELSAAQQAATMALTVHDGSREAAIVTLLKWNSRCETPWPRKDLEGFLASAAKRQSASRVWAVRREEREAREQRAAKVKELAKLRGVGLRQAQAILAEGTTDRETAEIAADLFGGDICDHLRPVGRRGRPIDWERRFLALRFDGGEFTDFARGRSMARVLGPANSLAELKARARTMGFGEETAESVWREFMHWRFDAFRTLIFGEEEFDFG